MLIGYKLLSNEALLRMFFFFATMASCFVEADGTLIANNNLMKPPLMLLTVS